MPNDGEEKGGKFAAFLRNYRLPLTLMILALVVLGFTLPSLLFSSEDETVPLTEVIEHIESGEVAEATVNENNRSVTVVLDDEDETEVTATYTALWSDSLTDALIEADVKTDIVPVEGSNFLLTTFISLLPLLLILALVVFLMRGTLKSGFGRVGEQADIPTTRFEDVAGVDEAVEEMRELVQFLREGDRFEKMGARTPRGALFVGPPGTGKTLLARAVAGEAGVPFFQVTGSDFVEMFAGLGASRVRSLFKRAKEAGRAIIFIDEIDSVGRRRGKESTSGGAMEGENTLTALLTEMDGFEQSEVIVIAATNRLDVLDPALRRRLEHVVEVPLPDRRGRSLIMQVHAKGKPFSDSVDWDEVGRQAYGMSGAEMERVINEACMDAVRRDDRLVTTDNLLRALSTIQVGRERLSAALTEHDKEITAWHEAGHAIACVLAENLSDPTFVTIVPRGQSGGHTRPGGSDDMFRSKAHMLDELVMSMGGRVGEELLLGKGNYTQGASGDISHATALATEMITQYGMGDNLIQTHPDTLRLGAEVSAEIQREANKFIKSAYADALKNLSLRKSVVEYMAKALIEEETLAGERLSSVIEEALATSHRTRKKKADTLPVDPEES